MTKWFLLLHIGQNWLQIHYPTYSSPFNLAFKCTFVSDYSLESVFFFYLCIFLNQITTQAMTEDVNTYIVIILDNYVDIHFSFHFGIKVFFSISAMQEVKLCPLCDSMLWNSKIGKGPRGWIFYQIIVFNVLYFYLKI